MARPCKLKPDYWFDKDSGRAFVTLNGKRKFLGAHGTQASRDEYDRVVGEWIAAGRPALPGQLGNWNGADPRGQCRLRQSSILR